MQWNLKKVFIVVAVLTALCISATQAQDTESLQTYTQTLHWKNGDALPGKLLESTSGKVRWASPYFSDDLVIDMRVLDSVVFTEQSDPATEDFRVVTVFGDIWMADIVDSDADTFLFSSKRHHQFRVDRAAIYTLERRVHPNLIFDGSQLANWRLPKQDENRPGVLFGLNAPPDWYADGAGHPRTDKVKSKIFHALDLPQRFAVELEFASAVRPPGFVFGFSKNLYQTLRLETWVNELVVVQGTLFKPVLTIQPDRRRFHLHLVYDGDTRVLEIFDFAGNLLLKLDGIEQMGEASGLYVYNRGQDLTVRRLRVYRQPTNPARQPLNVSKPRVHIMDGQVVYGKLFVEKESTYVFDADGTRRDIDLKQVNRVVQPGVSLTEADPPVAMTYPDGAVLHGKVDRVNENSVMLQTAFTDAPLTCVFTGASMLQIEPDHAWTRRGVEDKDKLFHPFGNLRGSTLFDGQDESLIRWKPVGALEAVRLANTEAIHIARNSRRASKFWPYNTEQFRHVLHLRNGENIPCQISAYDGTTVNFQSSFISAQHIDSTYVKALEFSGRTHAKDIGRARDRWRDAAQGTRFLLKNQEIRFLDPNVRKIERITRRLDVNPDGERNEPEVHSVIVDRGDKGHVEIIIDGQKVEELNPDNILILNDFVRAGNWIEFVQSQQEPNHGTLDVKLERALTVPRFSRDSPPSHILVAENGDMKRGQLLNFNGQTIQFDSKLRQFSVPIDRVARVVDVSVGGGQQSAVSHKKNDQSSEVLVKLTDGSILIFSPLEVKGRALLGRSSIYGAITVPVGSIEHLYFGNTTESFKDPFEAWVVRPAQEPTFGDRP